MSAYAACLWSFGDTAGPQVFCGEGAAAQLSAVKGISLKKAEKIKSAWDESRGQRDGVEMLRRLGVEDPPFYPLLYLSCSPLEWSFAKQ
jgi:hypothetical protein